MVKNNYKKDSKANGVYKNGSSLFKDSSSSRNDSGGIDNIHKSYEKKNKSSFFNKPTKTTTIISN